MRLLSSLIVSCSLAFVAGTTLAQAVAPPAVRLPPGVTVVREVEGITEYRLPNGLQVLLAPDASKPTTTVNLTYHVGSRHENYGETGMAHLLEHLLFKGSPKHPLVWGEFTKRGLQANGSTWFDRTNYTASFSANPDNLSWYLGWLADSMVNSFIARKDLDTEMTVVRNEMEMGENNPQRILFQRTLALMFDWHNYGKETIGARSDVENVDIPRLQAFYRQYYQPDNATLIVSGKFDIAATLGRIQAAFGPIPRPKRKLPTQYTLDPTQDGERGIVLRRVGGTPQLMAGYHMPPGGHADFAAAELLALVLGEAPSGRLHKRLTEKQLAASTFGYAMGLAEPSVLLFGAQLAPGQMVDAARDALVATIESLSAEPISSEELERARTRWLKNWDDAYTNPEVVGLSLSETIAMGDWRLFFLTRDRVKAIKLEDVQRVATQYLLPANRTLASYVPTERPARAPVPARVDIAAVMKEFKPASAAAQAEAFEATPANIDARTQRFEVGGLKAAVLPKATRGDAVQAVLTLRFGDEKSLFGLGEVASFTADLLDKGTTTMTREQVRDRFDALRTEVSIAALPAGVSVSLSSRRDTLPQALLLLGDLLRRPAFKPEAFDELRRQALTGIEDQRKEPEAVVANAVARLGNPYPRGDLRYAASFDEMVQDIQAITLQQVKDFHARFYGARQGEFAAAGALDAAAVQQALQQAFGDWQTGAPFARVPTPRVDKPAQRLVLQTPDKQNATLLSTLAMPINDTHPDYPALMLANYMLGSGGTSRLWTRVREKEGLSYDVRSTVGWNSHEENSRWTASAIFAPQNRDKVEAAMREEIARALKDGFTAQELEEARRGLLNFRRLSRAQDAGIAGGLANNLYLGRSFAVSQRVDEALGRATLAEVNAALRRYLKPESLVTAVGGDFKTP